MRIPLLAVALLAVGCTDPAPADPAVVSDTDVTVTTGDAGLDSDPGIEPTSVQPADGLPAADAPARVAATAPPSARPAAAPSAAASASSNKTFSGSGGDAETRTEFASFPTPFSVVVPDGASVEQPGSGDAVVIENDGSSVTVGVARGEAPQALLARLRGRVPEGIEVRPVATGWASGAFEYVMASQGPSFFEAVYVGQRDGTTFLIETSRSDEAPSSVVDAVLGSWRWADGSPLR